MFATWLDWLYLPRCFGCDRPAHTVCDDCRLSLTELGPACPRCAEPTGETATMCARCLRHPLPLAEIQAPWRFGGHLEAAIKRLKFARATHLARTLAPLWAGAIGAAGGDLVVPVPLHWRRRWQRGFDHAWLLALHACRAVDLHPTPALRRTRAAPPQSRLSAAERRANLRGAFVADARVAGKTITLVDDVVTTGATMAAAATALLAGGASRVVGVALARATSVPG